MRRWVFFSILAVLLIAKLAFGGGNAARENVAFGIEVLRYGLFNEAELRFRNAVDINPNYAEAWNDLAVMYELEDRPLDAKAAYETALKLAPKNKTIRENYEKHNAIEARVHRVH